MDKWDPIQHEDLMLSIWYFSFWHHDELMGVLFHNTPVEELKTWVHADKGMFLNGHCLSYSRQWKVSDMWDNDLCILLLKPRIQSKLKARILLSPATHILLMLLGDHFIIFFMSLQLIWRSGTRSRGTRTSSELQWQQLVMATRAICPIRPLVSETLTWDHLWRNLGTFSGVHRRLFPRPVSHGQSSHPGHPP